MKTKKDIFKVGSILKTDKNSQMGAERALGHFANLMNSLIDKLDSEGYISKLDITSKMFEELTMFECSELIRCIYTKYGEEASKIQYKAVKKRFLEEEGEAIDNIKNIIKEAYSTFKNDRLPKGYGYLPVDRAKYLRFDEGKVFCDVDKLKECNTAKIETREQADILNRANDIFNQLQCLQEEVARMSKGRVLGISDNDNSLIEIKHNVLYFNTENGEFLI